MRTPGWFRAPELRRKYCDRLGLFNQHVMQGYEPHDDRLVVPKLPNMSGIATRHHKGTHKVVKETSRTFKGGASNLPAALREPASEATLSVCFRDAAKQGPRANAKRMHEYRNGVRRNAMADLVLPRPDCRLTSNPGAGRCPSRRVFHTIPACSPPTGSTIPCIFVRTVSGSCRP
jgi:hypothetical protein